MVKNFGLNYQRALKKLYAVQKLSIIELAKLRLPPIMQNFSVVEYISSFRFLGQRKLVIGKTVLRRLTKILSKSLKP